MLPLFFFYKYKVSIIKLVRNSQFDIVEPSLDFSGLQQTLINIRKEVKVD
jgi:hypothetical protein